MVTVFTAFLVGAVLTAPTMANAAALTALAAILVASWWIAAGRPRVMLTASQVVVINPFWTYRRELADIVEVHGGWFGLWIQTREQRPIAAWAVQKANFSTWLGRRTRADEVAEEISAAALVHRNSDNAFGL